MKAPLPLSPPPAFNKVLVTWLLFHRPCKEIYHKIPFFVYTKPLNFPIFYALINNILFALLFLPLEFKYICFSIEPTKLVMVSCFCCINISEKKLMDKLRHILSNLSNIDVFIPFLHKCDAVQEYKTHSHIEKVKHRVFDMNN